MKKQLLITLILISSFLSANSETTTAENTHVDAKSEKIIQSEEDFKKENPFAYLIGKSTAKAWHWNNIFYLHNAQVHIRGRENDMLQLVIILSSGDNTLEIEKKSLAYLIETTMKEKNENEAHMLDSLTECTKGRYGNARCKTYFPNNFSSK